MNTREMLEFAAIAAGFYFDPTVKSEHGSIYGCFDDKAQEAYFWDPIANAADRYDLARRCSLVLDFEGCEVRYVVPGDPSQRAFRWEEGDERDEAYCVVRAAAEIGKRR